MVKNNTKQSEKLMKVNLSCKWSNIDHSITKRDFNSGITIYTVYMGKCAKNCISCSGVMCDLFDGKEC